MTPSKSSNNNLPASASVEIPLVEIISPAKPRVLETTFDEAVIHQKQSPSLQSQKNSEAETAPNISQKSNTPIHANRFAGLLTATPQRLVQASSSQVLHEVLKTALKQQFDMVSDQQKCAEYQDEWKKECKNEFLALCALPEGAEKCLRFLSAYYHYEKRKTVLNTYFFSQSSLAFVSEQLKQYIQLEAAQNASNSNGATRTNHFLNEISRTMQDYNKSQSPVKVAKLKANVSGCSDVINALKSLQELICPLDVDSMLQLFAENAEAAKNIAEQDVTLVLGNTGAGKTTLVRFLAGSTFTLTTDGHYEPNADHENAALESFITAPGGKSETRHINSITLNHPSTSTPLTLCDTPGYGDTRSTEIDIANGLGVAAAVRNSRSARVILLINQSGLGERNQGLPSLTDKLEKFLPPIISDEYLESFTYIYANFSSKARRDALIRGITECRDNALNDNYSQRAKIFEDMLTKLEDNKSFFIDPCDQSNQQALFAQLTTCPTINNPEEVFQDFVLNESLVKLEKQVAIILKSFKQAFLTGDIAIAQHKYNQLERLNHFVKIEAVSSAYKEVNELIETVTRDLFQKMSNILILVNDNTLESPHLHEAKAHFNVYVQYLYNLRKFQDGSIYQEDRDALILLGDYLTGRLNTVSALCQLHDEQAFVWNTISQGLDSLKKLNDLFDSSVFTGGYDASYHFSDTYKRATKTWSERYKNYFDNALSALEKNALTHFINNADNMREINDNFIVHLSPESQNLYQDMRIALERYFGDAAAIICKNPAINLSDWPQNHRAMMAFYEPLSKLKSGIDGNVLHLNKYIGIEVLKSNYSQVLQTVEQYFDKIIHDLQTNVDKLDAKTKFTRLENVLSCLKTLSPLDVSFVELYKNLAKYLVEVFDVDGRKLTDLCVQFEQQNKVLRATDSEELVKSYNMLFTLKESVRSLTELKLGNKFYDIRHKQAALIQDSIQYLNELTLSANTTPQALYSTLIKLSSIQSLLKSAHPLVETEFPAETQESISKAELFLKSLLQETRKVFDDFDMTQINVGIKKYIHVFHFLHLHQQSPEREHLSRHKEIMLQYAAYLSKLDTWVNTVKASLESSFDRLNDSDLDATRRQEAAKNVVDALLALNTFNQLCVDSGIVNTTDGALSAQTHSVRSTLKAYFSSKESNGRLQNFMAGTISQLNNFDSSTVYLYLGIAKEFAHLDNFLESDANGSNGQTINSTVLSSNLKTRASELENRHLITLRECMSSGKYSSFVTLYKNLSNPNATDAKEIATKLTDIANSTLQNIKNTIDSASKLMKKPIADMSEQELISYLSCISELENYREISALLKNAQHKALVTQIDTLLSAYKTQVTAFSRQINAIAGIGVIGAIAESAGAVAGILSEGAGAVAGKLNDGAGELLSILTRGRVDTFFAPTAPTPVKRVIDRNEPEIEFIDIYRCYSASQNALSLLPVPDAGITAQKDPHEALRNAINENEARFAELLYAACKQYENVFVPDYTNKLQNLCQFLASIQPKYQDIYNQLNQTLIKNINEFSQMGDPTKNHGWDLQDNCAIIAQKESLFPLIVQTECAKQIKKVKDLSARLMQAELERLEQLSIVELSKRLYFTSNETYGKIVKLQLELLVDNVAAEIRALFDSKNIYGAVRKLDEVWLDLRIHDNNNHKIDPRWQCDLSALSDAYATLPEQIAKIFNRHLLCFSAALPAEQNSFVKINDSFPMIQAFVCLCASENRTKSDSLYNNIFSEKTPDNIDEMLSAAGNMLHAKAMPSELKSISEYLLSLQNIIDFYVDLRNNFSKSVAMHDFSIALHNMKLLRGNQKVMNDVVRLICHTNYYNALSSLGIKFQNPDLEFNLRSGFTDSYAGVEDKVRDQFAILSHDAFLSVNTDRRFESANITDKESFHRSIFVAYEGLKKYSSSAIYLEFGQKKAYVLKLLKDAQARIQENLLFIIKQAIDVISESFPSENAHAYRVFDNAYQNLTIAQKECKDPEISTIIEHNITSLQQALTRKLEKNIAAIMDNKAITLNELMLCLFKLKIMSLHMNQFKQEATAAIETLLQAVKTHHFDQCSILTLSEALEASPNHQAHAKMLLEAHAVFKSFVIGVRNEKTLFNGIDYICKKLEENNELVVNLPANGGLPESRANTALNTPKLKEQYSAFEIEYWLHVEQGLEPASRPTVQDLIKDVYNFVDNPNMDYPLKIIKLTACLFAYWSIEDYKKRMDSDAISGTLTEDMKNFILQPHPAQIVSIFRLLGIDVNVDLEAIMEAAPVAAAAAKASSATKKASASSMQEISQRYLQNHLAEIPTGEGKSIALAVTAMLFALMDYEVDCACYSDYLSRRDYNDFHDLFQAFKLDKKIFYGTHKDLSERWIDQEYGDVRTKVDSLIRQISDVSSKGSEKKTSKPRILLLDEVDVFFGPDFCGSTYKLSHMFSSPEVFQLVKYIWDNSNKNMRDQVFFDNVKSCRYYILTHNKLIVGMDKILDSAIKSMIEDVKIYRNSKKNQTGSFVFDVTTQRIGYQTQGHVPEYNIAFRYQTMFAYIDFVEQKMITNQAVLSGKIGLLIECGSFSYARMPKHYQNVLGVTGTLSTLSENELTLLNSIVTFERFTYMPSAYGGIHLDFPMESSVQVINNNAYFDAITKEIIKYRTSNHMGVEQGTLLRPVMVFFESSEELSAYYSFLQSKISAYGAAADLTTDIFTPAYDINTTDITLLYEKTPDNERDSLIARATHAGTITLSTAAYGRGTDFRCFYDKRVNDAGGPHVLQAFFAHDIAQETQIKGRTSRQGANGSYSIVLHAGNIQNEYVISSTALQEVNSNGEALYTVINNARMQKLALQYKERQEALDKIASEHSHSIGFADNLIAPRSYFSSNKTQNKPLLNALNELNGFETVIEKRKTNGQIARTIVLIDATGSMSHVLQAVKNTAAMMFERAQEILDNNSGSGSMPDVQMQFVFYQNYSSGTSKILQYSGWINSDNYDKLKSFLHNIRAEGGQGNEAVEIALAYVNQLLNLGTKIQQIIWIGDMPPNTTKEVNTRRESSSWNSLNPKVYSLFAHPVYFDTELGKIVTNNVPVHAYWVQGSYYNETGMSSKIMSVYQDTSTKTKGQSGLLDINSAIGSEALANVVTERILNDIGGEKLVNAYRVKYCPSHTSASIGGHSAAASASTAAVSPAAASSGKTFVPLTREQIVEILSAYRSSTKFFSKVFHLDGRKEAKELLKKAADKGISDEDIFNAFATSSWANAPRDSQREVHASKYIAYGSI